MVAIVKYARSAVLLSVIKALKKWCAMEKRASIATSIPSRVLGFLKVNVSSEKNGYLLVVRAYVAALIPRKAVATPTIPVGT